MLINSDRQDAWATKIDAGQFKAFCLVHPGRWWFSGSNSLTKVASQQLMSPDYTLTKSLLHCERRDITPSSYLEEISCAWIYTHRSPILWALFVRKLRSHAWWEWSNATGCPDMSIQCADMFTYRSQSEIQTSVLQWRRRRRQRCQVHVLMLTT